jgi:N-acetylglutamate synthase-like GNAT family acetyltransferase
LTQQLETRSATDADAVSLSAFLNACTLAHQGVARSSRVDVLARLHQGGADPRHDSFVVSDRGTIVGFAHIWPDGADEIKFFAPTHPDARERGVGTQLLQACDAAPTSSFRRGDERPRRGPPTSAGRRSCATTAIATSGTS